MYRVVCCFLGLWLAGPLLADEAVNQLVAAVTSGRAEEVRELLVQGG